MVKRMPANESLGKADTEALKVGDLFAGVQILGAYLVALTGTEARGRYALFQSLESMSPIERG
jgi:hypothetical protein